MRSGIFTTCVRGLLTVSATAVGLFLLHAGYNWIWLHTRGPQAGPPISFGHCQVMASALIACQLPVLLLGAIAAAVLRGRYRMGVGLLAGLLLFFLTVVAPTAHLYTSETLGCMVYFAVFPLLVSALQWLPEGRNGDASNNALQEDAVLPAESRRPIRHP